MNAQSLVELKAEVLIYEFIFNRVVGIHFMITQQYVLVGNMGKIWNCRLEKNMLTLQQSMSFFQEVI